MERKDKLIQLRDFLSSGNEQFKLATELEAYFLGTRTGCNCKYNHVRSKLNQAWETSLKAELLSYEEGD